MLWTQFWSLFLSLHWELVYNYYILTKEGYCSFFLEKDKKIIGHQTCKGENEDLLEFQSSGKSCWSCIKLCAFGHKIAILSFHMTSPTFKLRIIDSSECSLSWDITAAKHLYLIYTFSVWKDSSFCNRGCLNFQAFAWHGI